MESKLREALRSQVDLKDGSAYAPTTDGVGFNTFSLAVTVRNWTQIIGVSNIFYNQFRISRCLKTWITPDKMRGALKVSLKTSPHPPQLQHCFVRKFYGL